MGRCDDCKGGRGTNALIFVVRSRCYQCQLNDASFFYHHMSGCVIAVTLMLLDNARAPIMGRITARVKTKPQLEVSGRSDDLETSLDWRNRVSCVSSLFV